MIWDNWRVLDWVIAGLAFGLVLAVWTVVVIMWRLRRRIVTDKVRKHLNFSFGAEETPMRQLRLWHDGKEATTSVPVNPRQPSAMQRLDRLRVAAGWQMTTPALLLAVIGIAMTGFVGVHLLLGNMLLSATVGGGVVAGFWVYLKRCVGRRESIFEQQLADSLELAARSLRAGHPLMASFQVISDEIPAPVGALFGQVCQQHELGVSLEDALHQIACETASSDMKLFGTSVVIQSRSGGNLADMMQRLAAVIRDRIRISRQIRALMAQTQFSKRLLLVLPFLMLLALSICNPHYLTPLYSTQSGKIMIGFAAMGMLLGAWAMNRLSRLRY